MQNKCLTLTFLQHALTDTEHVSKRIENANKTRSMCYLHASKWLYNHSSSTLST